MRLGAFLTHGLLSLVTNVVNDISLTSPQPPPISPPHLGFWYPARGGAAHRISLPLTTSGSPSPSLDSVGCVWCWGGGYNGPLGSTKACLPVLFTAKALGGTCALERSETLQEDKIRAVYLSLSPLMFLGLLSQAFNPFLSHLPFICDLIFGLLAGSSVWPICQTDSSLLVL